MNESLIKKFLPKIRYIISNLNKYNKEEINKDLIQEGIIGLLKAEKLYKESGKANFSTFSEYYIKGSILDYIRSNKWHSREAGRKLYKIKKAYEFLESKLNRKIEEEDVIKYLKISSDQFYKDLNILNITNFDDVIKEDKYKNLDILEVIPNKKLCLNLEIKNIELKNSISKLSKYDQKLIILYFFYDYKMIEIGKMLNKTESNISIRIKKVLKQLKNNIQVKSNEKIILKDLTNKPIFNMKIKLDNNIYQKAKNSLIGEIIKCVYCEKEFKKKNSSHIYCSNKGEYNCKYLYRKNMKDNF